MHDHLGHAGRLHCNDLSWRHWWEPLHLVMPLYGVTDFKTIEPAAEGANLTNVLTLHKASIAR